MAYEFTVRGRIARPVHEVFGAPRDPYTRRLLASVPVPDPARARARLAALAG